MAEAWLENEEEGVGGEQRFNASALRLARFVAPRHYTARTRLAAAWRLHTLHAARGTCGIRCSSSRSHLCSVVMSDSRYNVKSWCQYSRPSDMIIIIR